MKHLMQTLLTLSLLLLTSCNHREFDYAQEDIEVAYIDVVFDWCNEPDANPESMSLYLFPDDGREPVRHEFVGREGGTIRVTAGTYHAICVNSDNRDVFIRNKDSHSTFEITTSEVTTLSLSNSLKVSPLDVPRASGSEDQKIVNQPPLLWSSSQTDIVITSGPSGKGRTRAGNQELRMYPVRIVDTYVVTVNKINNIQNLQSLSATISDMSDGYLPAPGSPNESSAIISLDMSHDAANANAQGTFLTFGHCPADVRRHRLMLYALLTDDSKYYYEFDVSEQAHQGPADDNVHYITIELIDIPETGGHDTGGGGMSPTVDDWQTVNINLDM